MISVETQADNGWKLTLPKETIPFDNIEKLLKRLRHCDFSPTIPNFNG
jgi:hypothetical protein